MDQGAKAGDRGKVEMNKDLKKSSESAHELNKNKNLALIRIRGITGIKKSIKDTLNMLKLFRRNYCVVVPDSPNYRGMCNKVKDFITWGEVDEDTLKLLKDKRLKKGKNKQGQEYEKKFFALHPPRKGFERKGIKVSFKSGGALGYRGAKINELIKRML